MLLNVAAQYCLPQREKSCLLHLENARQDAGQWTIEEF